MRSFRISTFFKTAVFVWLLIGCGREFSETTPPKGEPMTARVETVEATQLPVFAILPGTVVSADRVEVSSRLTGYVYDIKVHEGQSVKKDQLLFAVDPTDVKEQIRQARAELANAKAALDNVKDNYARYQLLYRQQAATKTQYQEVEKNYKVALGNYHAAEAALTAARSQLKYAEVRAPFDALVVSKLIDSGQLTSPGAPVLILENPDHLQVQVEVDRQAFAALTLGQQIDIRFEGPNYEIRSVSGTVERRVTAANPVTHTHLVKLGLPADSGAWSGEFALVSIPVGKQQGIVVPEGAVYNRAGIMGVFVVDSEGRAQFRMVTLGSRTAKGRVVLSGLFPGERLIVSANGALANGVEIRIQPGGQA